MYKNFYFKHFFKKGLLTFGLLFAFCIANAQSLVWKNSVTGTSTSANGRAPQASHRYTRTVYLVAAGELSAGGIDAGKVLKAIGFNYNAASTTAAVGTLKIYLQNTADVSYSKGTSWATAISTMTKVSDAAATIPTAATANFVFENGNTFTYTGGAMYVAFEWLNLEGTLGSSKTAYCNSSTTNTGAVDGLYSAFSTSGTTPSDNISSNNFRPATRFAYELLNNDAKVSNIYAMSTAPVNEGKQNISARITNEGINPIYNLNVTLTISGANSFINTKTISLPVETPIESGAGYNINFDEFIPVNQGHNTITVTINGTDDDNSNNTENVTQEVILGLFSYNLGTVISSNGGSSSQNYKYAVKYTANGTVYPRAARFLLSTNATVVGHQLKANWYNANWELMGESEVYTAIAGDQGKLVTLYFNEKNVPVPNIGGSTDFYVSIQLVSVPPDDPASNTTPKAKLAVYFMGRQNELETPAMAGTYFSGVTITPPTGLAASSSKPTIEAITTLATLPVNISTFTAKLNNGKVALHWTVGTEKNVNHYEIERSSNGIDFVKAAQVTANGAAIYNTIDDKPTLGINYYRLKGVDNDGTLSPFNELRVIKIMSLNAKEALVYPNPIVGSTINIGLSGYTKGAYAYKLTDVSGKLIQKGSFANSGSESSAIMVTNGLPAGTYLLQIINGREIIQSKLIKQ
ncbi:T9SS type A sorting domain-containing protein [Pedobacter sp. ASV28]|uniref:T9SS type A sorting domain-containing protein n=1 Tax=Pedobacter sp. ASV28 TaxID=2795123 RepID=UPI0018EAD8A7|nr:T9SS type A sorting domain-containing protein [Pedobacter sp. ASV28]